MTFNITIYRFTTERKHKTDIIWHWFKLMIKTLFEHFNCSSTSTTNLLWNSFRKQWCWISLQDGKVNETQTKCSTRNISKLTKGLHERANRIEHYERINYIIKYSFQKLSMTLAFSPRFSKQPFYFLFKELETFLYRIINFCEK